MPPRRRLIVTVTDARGRALPAGRTLGAWLTSAAPTRTAGEVAIALVSDVAMRRMNRTFRGKDVATDVLSFPANPGTGHFSTGDQGRGAGTIPDSRGLWKSDPSPPFLGDIVIANGICRRQAREAGHSETVERRILALHGLLHLLGYDHDTDHGRMRRVEERLRRRAGLSTGLIARSHRF